MLRRILCVAVVLTSLSACARPAPAANVATVAPVEVTRVVTQVATRIVRQTVVVTATPAPATNTPVLPTATDVPTAAPEPTMQSGVTAATTQAATMYALPDEEAYKPVIDLPAGTPITVIYRGGQWFNVRTADGQEGWLYKDWINLPSEQHAAIPIYPEARPVVTGRVVQEALAGSVIFKGRVLNVGAQPAYSVQVEIETFDANDQRLDLVTVLINNRDLASEEASSFEAISSFGNYDSYTIRLHWDY